MVVADEVLLVIDEGIFLGAIMTTEEINLRKSFYSFLIRLELTQLLLRLNRCLVMLVKFFYLD